MQRCSWVFALVVLWSTVLDAVEGGHSPPAAPLFCTSPYVSIWAQTDTLTEKPTAHWTGIEQQLALLIRVDEVAYRLLGPFPDSVPPLPQKSLVVHPTQTIATFEGAGVNVVLYFTTPAMPSKPELFARPVSFVDFQVSSGDGKPHDVSVYGDMTSQICLGDKASSRNVTRDEYDLESVVGTLHVMKMGSINQPVFENPGDWVTITWGYAYLAGLNISSAAVGMVSTLRSKFATSGNVTAIVSMPGELENVSDYPGAAIVLDLGTVQSVSSKVWLQVAYDEVSVLDFFGEVLQPAWYGEFEGINDLLRHSTDEHDAIFVTCTAFDSGLRDSLTKAGGADYAYLCSLIFRQVTAACALARSQATADASPYSGHLFMKEISSDGDVSTVDVIYPASPFFLLQNPDLLWQLLEPILLYANNETSIKYNLSWAPHHLGTWPVANLPPEKQEQMPDEETANMFLMLAGLAQHYESTAFIEHYSHLLQNWADFLVLNALDPGNQLCSDDFEGPSPHNVNLALKAILGLAAYGKMQEIAGNTTAAAYYTEIARLYAEKWQIFANDTDHYRLQYNLPSSWSMKYNLIWQKILNLDCFPQHVIDVELVYYSKQSLEYGIPLDSRKTWAKLDWASWIAALGSQEYFQSSMLKLVAFADHQFRGWPLGDWYLADIGWPLPFRARPVLGALFVKILV